MLTFRTFTPLHAGTGQGIGVIDLPIAREGSTQIPILPGSGIKGVFRDAAVALPAEDNCEVEKIFGPLMVDESSSASSIAFTDGKLVLFPVRSIAGIFAWVTCPFILGRLFEESTIVGLQAPNSIPTFSDQNQCFAHANNQISVRPDRMVIEDISLTNTADPTGDLEQLCKFLADITGMPENKLQQKLCVVSDDVMLYLLKSSTEVRARIRIDDEKKIVADGQLWYEETLPAETFLISLCMAGGPQVNQDVVVGCLETLISKNTLFQFGGKQTVGHGFCKVKAVVG